MPADPEVIKRIMRDPEFKGLNPQRQLDTMHRYMSGADEEYVALPTVGQQYHTAGRVIDAHTPGFLSKVLDIVPVIGPVKRAYEDPNQIRPITRAAAGLLGLEDVAKMPLGAASAEIVREIAELIALGGVGGKIAGAVGIPMLASGLTGPISKYAESFVAKTGQALFEKGLVAGAEKTMIAGAARLGIERLAARATTDGTIGAMYGLVDAVERNDYNPLHMLAAPVLGAALGAGLAGLHNVRTRFGEDAARRVVQTLQENPQLNAVIAEAKPIQAGYARAAGVAPEAAGDVVSRALSGELLDAAEFNVMRRVLTSDPKFLQTDTGLRILQTQKEHLMPKVAETPPGVEPPTRLEVRVEMPGGASKTIIDPKPATVQQLLADNHQGRIRIIDATGPGEDDFIEMARDTDAGFQAYKNSLPASERKKLAEASPSKKLEAITEIEASERFNTLSTESQVISDKMAGTENVGGGTFGGGPGPGPIQPQYQRPTGPVVQPGMRGAQFTPAEIPPELMQKVAPHIDKMVSEQLGSSYDPALRAATTGEIPLVGTDPFTGEMLPRSMAKTAVPYEAGAPIRLAGEVKQAKVVSDQGGMQVVQREDGTLAVTGIDANGSAREMVRLSENMVPEFDVAASAESFGPYTWKKVGPMYKAYDANGNEVLTRNSRTGIMTGIKRLGNKPGPKAEAEKILDQAITPSESSEIPISQATPGQIQKAMDYYDDKFIAGTITEEENKKLSILIRGRGEEKLTTAELQTCIRIN